MEKEMNTKSEQHSGELFRNIHVRSERNERNIPEVREDINSNIRSNTDESNERLNSQLKMLKSLDSKKGQTTRKVFVHFQKKN